MNQEILTECNAAFHRFLRNRPMEVDPGSAYFEILKIAFTNGFSEGGKSGVKRLGDAVAKDLGEQFLGDS